MDGSPRRRSQLSCVACVRGRPGLARCRAFSDRGWRAPRSWARAAEGHRRQPRRRPPRLRHLRPRRRRLVPRRRRTRRKQRGSGFVPSPPVIGCETHDGQRTASAALHRWPDPDGRLYLRQGQERRCDWALHLHAVSERARWRDLPRSEHGSVHGVPPRDEGDQGRPLRALRAPNEKGFLAAVLRRHGATVTRTRPS
jgi:hypothetical protein